MKKLALVDVFNGEGYSSPIVKTTFHKKEADKFIKEQIESYGESAVVTKGEVEDNPFNIVFNIEKDKEGNIIDEDYGSLYVFELPKDKVTILLIQPDECNVSIFGEYDTLEDARATLSEVLNDPKNSYDEEEIEEFNEDPTDSFGSHGEQFDYYEIIS